MRSQRKAGVLLSYANTGISMLVSLIYTPLMLRLLGQSEYGVYQAAASIISYLGLLSLGFGSSYMRFFARHKAKDDGEAIGRLNGLFLLVFGAAAVLSLLAGGVLTSMPEMVFGNKFSLDQLAVSQKLLAIMTVNTAVAFINSVFSMYVNAHERFVYQRVLGIITTLLKPAVTLPLLLLGYGSVGLTLVSTAVIFASLISNIICARKLGFRVVFTKPDMGLLREITVFSIFIFITSMAGTINTTIDIILLSRFSGPDAVAVYEIGSKFNGYLATFSITVSNVFIPKINMMIAERNNNDELTDLMIRIGRIQFFIITLILGGFALLGRYFIGVYAGDGYWQAYTVAIFIMCGSFVPYIQNIGIEIQKAKNKHVFRSLAYLAIALCNIAVSIPLIKQFGISGAAIGSALALIIGNTIVMNIYYKKGIGLDMGRFWKAMLKPASGALLSLVPFLLLVNFWRVDRLSRFIVVGLAFVVSYVFTAWFIGMNEEEKSLVRSSLPNRRRIT